MTPERIKQCVEIIRRSGPLGQRGLAALIGYDERHVRRWVSDAERSAIPADVAEWLEKVTAFYQGDEMRRHAAMVEEFYANNPPPARIRRNAA